MPAWLDTPIVPPESTPVLRKSSTWRLSWTAAAAAFARGGAAAVRASDATAATPAAASERTERREASRAVDERGLLAQGAVGMNADTPTVWPTVYAVRETSAIFMVSLGVVQASFSRVFYFFSSADGADGDGDTHQHT